MAKAMGTIPLLSKGVPLMFMGEEVGETRAFSFDNYGIVTNPQVHDLPPVLETDNTRVLNWFRQILGLRNDPGKRIRGNDTSQVVKIGRRTVAFTCGPWRQIFAVVTFGTEDREQNTAWLGLPDGSPYKEIFNSSWPAFQTGEPESSNGGYGARIRSGENLNLPYIGAVILERC